MKNLILARLFALLFVVASVSLVQSQAQNVYHVRAGATGAGNGTDWNNAYSTLPATLKRGATYYIAAGSYSSYVFDDAVSGTTLITVKKATESEHGSETGWESAFGDGQALFNGAMQFTTDYWEFDGVTGGGPENQWTNNFGFKVQGTGSFGNPVRVIRILADHIAVRHTHLKGSATETTRDLFAHGFDASGTGAGVNLTFSYGWCENLSLKGFAAYGGLCEYVYFDRFYPWGGGNGIDSMHFVALRNWPARGDITARYNYFTYYQPTGLITLGGDVYDNCESCRQWDVFIYGNIFDCTQKGDFGGGGVIRGYAGRGWGDKLYIFNNSFHGNKFQFTAPDSPTFQFFGPQSIYSDTRIFNNVFTEAPVRNRPGSWKSNSYWDSDEPKAGETGAESLIGLPWVAELDMDFDLIRPTASGIDLTSYNSIPMTSARSTEAHTFHLDFYGNSRGADGVWDRGALEFGIGVPDTQAPVTSNPSASSISSTGAVIAWSTDEPASSTVEYGTTTAYGSTAASISLVLAHSVVLSDLNADTLYHYRVVSRDLAGNTATSGDFTFRTGVPDITPPAIALTSPLPGSILSNQASFQANATDNVGGSGVVEVAFYVDGELAGEGVTSDSTNYGLSWDTTTVANGAYSVQAVARDAEGNEAASAAINVTVENTLPDLTDGLLGYWSLDETSGMVANDSSGNGNHGVVMRESGWTTGRLKGARTFSGAAADHYVDLGPINVTGDQLTLAAWIKPFSFGHDPRVVAKSEGIDTGQMYWLLEVDDGSPHRVGFRVNAGGSEVRLTGGTVEAGQWIHVVGAYDGTRMRLYLNGVEIASQAQTGSLRTGSAPAWIGNNPPDGQRPFDGVIDDVRIYNRALTSADIARLQEKTNPNPPGGIQLLGN